MDLTARDNSLEDIAVVAEANSEQTVLVQGAASDEITAKALAQKHGVEFIRLSETELSSQVVRLIPHWLIKQHNIIVVKFEEDTLYVAMTNPVDLPTLDQINLVTGFNVKPLVATERDIIKAISQHYGAEQLAKQDLVDIRIDRGQTEECDQRIEDLVLSNEAGQVARLVNYIMKDGIESHVSDIHFEPANDEMVVRFRVDGILHDCLTIPAAVRKEVVSRLKVLAKLDITAKRKAQDGHINLKYKKIYYDLRVSVMPTIDGEKMVLRILNKNSKLSDLATLGIGAEERTLVDGAVSRPYGMILITGPTGSGKTTTLYTMLHSLDAIEKNIITIENPVEYQLDRINQIQINPASGETFAGALRSILRQDPDIIMLGEIRDLETAEIAVQAALTGHLVLSTLHTNDAPSAITRLIDM